MTATLTVWQLGVDPADPATHPNTSFAVNNTWTLISNSISMIAGSFDLRVEFYLERWALRWTSIACSSTDQLATGSANLAR
jgi:hypothetical protein